MSDELVEVFGDVRPGIAQIVRNALAAEGVEAFLTNQSLVNAAGELPLGWATAARVVVPAPDAERARAIVARLRAEERTAVDREPGDESESQAAGDIVEPRPACPKCGRPRTSVCPVCQTSGVDFPFADGQPEDLESNTGWLICPACDEPFGSRYLRRCEWCGHDFGEGLDVASSRHGDTGPLNQRIVTLVLVLTVLLIGLVGYFVAITR